MSDLKLSQNGKIFRAVFIMQYMKISDQQINTYKNNGFIMLPGFFLKSDFEDLLSAAESILSMQIQKIGIKMEERPSTQIDLSRPFESLVETLLIRSK